MSRATKDLDLGTRIKIAGSVEEQREILLSKLQERVMLEAEDHFQFRVVSSGKLIESAPYGGFRFSVRSILAGKLFVAYSLDVGFGDAITPPIEEIEGTDWLDFYGLPPAKFEAISLEQQFAEKIHAMTVDRGERENSRVKDLVDIVLLIKTRLNQERVSASIRNTFRRHGKTSLPAQPPNPPDSWRHPFTKMAAECGLTTDFDSALNILSGYWSEFHHTV